MLRAHQFALQLLQGAAFDLPHPLLGNAELLAERFQRRAFIGKPALGNDPELALVQCAEGPVQPGRPPRVVDAVADDLVGEGSRADDEVLTVRSGAVASPITGAFNDRSGPDRRESISATSSRETPMARAMVSWMRRSLTGAAPLVRRARSRRRLKNSAFCVDDVPPRTIDQLRRT